MATIFDALLPFINNMKKDQVGDDRPIPHKHSRKGQGGGGDEPVAPVMFLGTFRRSTEDEQFYYNNNIDEIQEISGKLDELKTHVSEGLGHYADFTGIIPTQIVGGEDEIVHWQIIEVVSTDRDYERGEVIYANVKSVESGDEWPAELYRQHDSRSGQLQQIDIIVCSFQ